MNVLITGPTNYEYSKCIVDEFKKMGHEVSLLSHGRFLYGRLLLFRA